MGATVDASGKLTGWNDAPSQKSGSGGGAPRRVPTIGRGGLNLQIEGLAEMTAGIALTEREIASVWRDIMRGPFGAEFLDELKARTSDSRRTGYTLSRMKVTDRGKEGVEIGIPSDDLAQHPSSKRANARSIGVWLESGTRMHLVPTKITPWNHISIGGRVVSQASHPGTKATKPMFRTLQLYKRDFATLFVRELDRRLGPRIGTTGIAA